jgi:hypothetical protein
VHLQVARRVTVGGIGFGAEQDFTFPGLHDLLLRTAGPNGQCVEDTTGAQHAGRVGPQGDPGTDLAQFGSRLEDAHATPRSGQPQCGAESAHARTHDDDLGTAASFALDWSRLLCHACFLYQLPRALYGEEYILQPVLETVSLPPE